MEREDKEAKQDSMSRSLIERNLGPIPRGSFGESVGCTWVVPIRGQGSWSTYNPLSFGTGQKLLPGYINSQILWSSQGTNQGGSSSQKPPRGQRDIGAGWWHRLPQSSVCHRHLLLQQCLPVCFTWALQHPLRSLLPVKRPSIPGWTSRYCAPDLSQYCRRIRVITKASSLS